MAEPIIEDKGFADAFQQAFNGTSTTQEQETTTQEAEQQTQQETTTDTTTSQEAKDTPNYSEYFSQLSEGYVKDEDTFKSVIIKAKERDDLEARLKETETKIPQFKNDETRALYEAWANGDKESVVRYVRETTKDYKTMSDVDVVREVLAKKNPTWSDKDIDLELRAEYGKQLELKDLAGIEEKDDDGKYTDEYKAAVAHNERVEENLLRLQRAARDGRLTLLDLQSKIELPKIAQKEAPQTATAAPNEQELQTQRDRWVKSVEDVLPKLGSIKQTIDDKEVEYSFSDAENKEFGDYMKTFNLLNFAKEQGWYNADGTTNALKLAEDVRRFKNSDKITKAFATQVKTQTTKAIMKQIKNVDDVKHPESGSDPQSIAEAYIQARYGS